jgi:simple sugar transport system ATP-binding protein
MKASSPTTLLEAQGIVKWFGHVSALQSADFAVYPREIVALVGDNGAGKSTLVQILSGVLHPDGGVIRFEGEPVELHSPIDARALGIETVYQDLALALDLDPTINVFLGRERLRPGVLGRFGVVDRAAMRTETTKAFATLGVSVPSLTKPVRILSGGQRQGVAVSRAVMWANKVIFMDEPTAALGVRQTRAVLDLIRRVRESGCAVVLISHNMPEVLEVADRIEVLRLGQRVARFEAAAASIDDVVGAMTGAFVQSASQ